ncbi:MAG: hypothetical protein WAM04_12905 [Candidatus Sulfotelmatobacter sp.]
MVSLFVVSHLIPCCRAAAIHEQIGVGIEVAVPQLSRAKVEQLQKKFPSLFKKTENVNPRTDVCKDIVIWSEPKITVWDCNWNPCHEPLAIREWTVINRSDSKNSREKKKTKHRFDRSWLKEKTERARNITGYAVFIDGTCTPKKLTCIRIHAPWRDRAESRTLTLVTVHLQVLVDRRYA